MNTLEVLFTPAEFGALAERDLSRTVCVVFDILRATSSMITALANGAVAILPVSAISEALALRERQCDLLLAGERNGLRIRRDLTGGIDFDLANSPREFTREIVRGKTIVMTTTNGTRALRACQGASTVLVGSFLNLNAVAAVIEATPPGQLLVVCSGTHEEASYEDALAAGALCDLIWQSWASAHVADSAQIARDLFLGTRGNLLAAMGHSRNARRLLSLPELADDVPYCLDLNTTRVLAVLRPDGRVITKPGDERGGHGRRDVDGQSRSFY
ncbi:MAG: 2-phosphosulfolactate phosphatase [Verrucomicrobiales bacterium]|nr:2-phosphosulfolactate phosphatase [Verrucomicrobiales bacterium]